MKVSLIASEGGAGYYPENTVYAVRQSLATGVDGCELDFHLSADNAFVAHHDYQLNPALTRDQQGIWLDGPGPVIRHTSLGDLKKFDVGCMNPESKLARRYPQRLSHSPERIGTFQEVEQAYAELGAFDAQLWFEAKTNPFDEVNSTPAETYVSQLAEQLGSSALIGRLVLIAFDWRVLELAQRHLAGIQTGFLTIDFSWLTGEVAGTTDAARLGRWFGNFNPDGYGGSIPRAVKAAGGDYWSPYCRDLTSDAVTQAHELGLKVSTWGADSEAEIAAALAFGVDSLTTGYVDRAERVALTD